MRQSDIRTINVTISQSSTPLYPSLRALRSILGPTHTNNRNRSFSLQEDPADVNGLHDTSRFEAGGDRIISPYAAFSQRILTSPPSPPNQVTLPPLPPSIHPSPAPSIGSPLQHPFTHVRRTSRTNVHDLDHTSVIQQRIYEYDASESDFSSITLSTSTPVSDFESGPPPSGKITEANLSMYLTTLESWKEISPSGTSTGSSPSQEPVALPKPFTRKEGTKGAARRRKGRRPVVPPHSAESTQSESRESTPDLTFVNNSFFDSSTSPTNVPTLTSAENTGQPSTAVSETGEEPKSIQHRTTSLDETIVRRHHRKKRARIQQLKSQEQQKISMTRPQGTDETIERSPTMPYGAQLSNSPDAIMRSLVAELSEFHTGTSPMLSSRRWIEENRNTTYTIMRDAIGSSSQDPAYLLSVVLEIKLYPVGFSTLIALSIENDVFPAFDSLYNRQSCLVSRIHQVSLILQLYAIHILRRTKIVR